VANVIRRSEVYQIGQVEEKEKAEQVMIQVLQDAREVNLIQNKINNVIERITRVQRAWRTHLKKKEGFFELLRRLYIRNAAGLFEKVVIPKLRKAYSSHKDKLSYMRNIDVKNNEKGQELFITSYYRVCVEKYDEKYDAYRDHKRGLDKGERFAKQFLQFLQQKDQIDEIEDLPELETKNKRMLSIIEDIENNKMETSSAGESPRQTTKPPRLFVLPNIKDIEGLMAQCVETQVVEILFPNINNRLAKALNKFTPKIEKK